MLDSLFQGDTTVFTTISLGALAAASAVSLILGVVIAITCKIGTKASKNFLVTVALLPLLVQAVIIMVNGNLGTSIAIMGTFSLVRFRSLPGTSRDILFVFFAMAVGLATGMGQVWFALALTVLGCAMILLLGKMSIFSGHGGEQKLTITMPENLDYAEVFDDVFDEYAKKVELAKVKTTNMGSMYELSYSVILKNESKSKELVDKIRTRNGNCKVVLAREANEGEL